MSAAWTPLGRLRLLIWTHSVIGTALAGAVFGLATIAPNAPYAVGLMGCGVAWMLGFGPLRVQAEALAPEDRREPDAHPRWVPRILILQQLLAPAGSLLSPWGYLSLPADLLAGATIVVSLALHNALNLPVNRGDWGRLVAILAFGFTWNVVVLVLF